MNENQYYVVSWLLAGRTLFLLWCDGGAEPDRYLTHHAESPRLLTKGTRAEIVHRGRQLKLLVSDQETHVVDFESARKVLDRMRPNRPLSQRAAAVLLDVWNTFDDVSRSVGISLVTASSAKSEIDSDQLYSKVFFGNNLPAVTPADREYHPLLEPAERSYLRKEFRHALDQLSSLAIPDQTTKDHPARGPGPPQN